MSEKLQSELFTRLDAIAAKMGVGAGELWRILIKQASITGTQDLIWCLIFLALIAWGLWFCWKACGFSGTLSDRWSDMPGGIVVTVAIFVIFCFIGFGFDLDEAITALFNPEYWAYKHLLDGLK